MPDQNPGQPAPIVHPTAETVDFNKFFGPAATDDAAPVVTPTADPHTEVPAAELQPPKEEPAKPAVESEIAAALREMREAKERDSRVKEEANSWRAKHDSVMEQLEALRSAPKFEDDPLEYVRARKWTPEQQKEIVEILAYDLAPDRAPPDFRFRLFESKQARKERERQEQEQAQRAQQLQAQEAQIHQQYVAQLDAAASTFSPGSYPASEDWYGDNREAYVADLYRLANQVAEEAQAQGQRADLTAAALAAKLEQQHLARLAEIDTRRSKRQPKKQEPAQPVVTKPSDSAPLSMNGLRETAPRGPAQTDEERVRRAIEVAFGR